MKITYISASTIPSRSANSVHVMKMCNAFAQAGHTVTLLAIDGDRPAAGPTLAIDNEFTYYGVAPDFSIAKFRHPKIRWLGNAFYTGSIWRTARKQPRPHLFYARNLFGLSAVAHLGIPMILELHDIVRHPIVKLILQRLFRQKHLRGLVVVSQALADEYKRTFPELAAHKILVAHDAADEPPAEASTLPAEWPGRAEQLQIGYTGHLYPGRGIDVLLTIAQNTPTANFHIVGGTESDVRYWRDQVKGDNVHFHGYVAHRMVPVYLAQFDMVLAPYQTHVAGSGGKGDTTKWMSPLKIFEYMAAGKAIICSDLPVLREVLRHEENALLVQPADLAGWVDAVRTLGNDPDLRARLAQTAYQDFQANYTWQKRAEAVIHFANTLRSA